MPLVLLLITRLGLGLVYSLTTPPWEAYDEDGHFAYARYLAKHRTLLQPGDPEAAQVWEKFQPPLYYILIAAAIAGFDLGETFQAPERNPYMGYGNAGVNYAVHPDHLEGAAYQTVLAVYVARVLGVVISTASVLFVYLAARLIWPAEAATTWAAAGLYTFWPQFLFVGSMVTNDALVTSLAAVLVYLSIKLAKEGFHLWPAVLLSAVLGMALLTKLNALAFIPMALAAILMSLASGPQRARRWKSPGPWLVLAGLGLLIAVVVRLLGSLEFVTAQAFQVRTVTQFLESVPNLGEAKGPTGSNFVLAALRYGFRTFLASFGWGNLETYPWLYRLWTLGAGLSVVGLIVAGLQRSRLLPAPLHAHWVSTHPEQENGGRIKLLALMALQVVSLILLTLGLAISYQTIYLVPGRYLLPGLPAASFLLFAGWRALIPRGLRRPFWKAVSLGAVLVGWSIPFNTLAPAYARPRPLSSQAASVINAARAAPFLFGGNIQSLGYIQPRAAAPGEDLKISLCWQAIAPVSQNYPVRLEIVGPDGQGYGGLETYPGRGNYATSLWAVNTPFCDQYAVNIGKAIPAPSLAGLRVSLLNGVGGEKLPLTNLAGASPEDAAIWIPVKVQASGVIPALAHPARYRFGSGIVLSGYDLQALPAEKPGVRVALRWEALEDIRENYVVFVHLRDTPQNAYTQDDQQPRRGWYPTAWWDKGEVVLDEHTLY